MPNIAKKYKINKANVCLEIMRRLDSKEALQRTVKLFLLKYCAQYVSCVEIQKYLEI